MKLTMERKLELRFVLFVFISLLVLEVLIVGISLLHTGHAITLKADRVIEDILESGESPEAVDSRYFIVTYPSDGRIEIDTTSIGRISREKASEYSEKAVKSTEDKGYIDNYRYKVKRTKDEIKVVFLSRKLQLESFQSYALTLVVISISGIVLMTLFAFLVSKKVISPLVRNREKQKEFITSASHSLKTPLTVISADSQLLESEIGENEWLFDIMKETEKMTEMTNRLVFLSRIEEQSENIPMIEFPLSDIARERAESYKAVAIADGKTYFVDIEDALEYKGDEKAIEELLTALIDNAFKYGDDKGKVNVHLSRKGRYISLSVENTVESGRLKSIEHFKERFYRSDTSSKTKGFGIGLSVADAVTKEHQGKLIIEKTNEKSIKITALLKIRHGE